MSANIQGVSVSAVNPTDDFPGNRFHLEVSFAARFYGQVNQNRLLIFRPLSRPNLSGAAYRGGFQ